MKERMWNNRVDEHTIAVREEPILHHVTERNVSTYSRSSRLHLRMPRISPTV